MWIPGNEKRTALSFVCMWCVNFSCYSESTSMTVCYVLTSIPVEAKDFGSVLSSPSCECDLISSPRSCYLQEESGTNMVCMFRSIPFQLLGKPEIKEPFLSLSFIEQNANMVCLGLRQGQRQPYGMI